VRPGYLGTQCGVMVMFWPLVAVTSQLACFPGGWGLGWYQALQAPFGLESIFPIL